MERTKQGLGRGFEHLIETLSALFFVYSWAFEFMRYNLMFPVLFPLLLELPEQSYFVVMNVHHSGSDMGSCRNPVQILQLLSSQDAEDILCFA